MSPKANKETSRGEPAINCINSLEDMARMTRDFVEAVEVFRSTNGYQSLVELIDRIPKMEADIQQKENALRKAEEDVEKEKRAHAAERERSLQTYADESERFRKEKVGMEQRLTGLQKTSSEKDETIIVLKRREEDLKAAGKKVEETCKVKMNLLKEKETELLKISKKLEESQIQVTSLLATLKATKNEVSASKRSLEEAQQSNVHLEKDLVTLRGRNEELENFSVQLVNTDPNDIAIGMNKIWETATALVRDFLNQDLSDDLLKRPWTALDNAAKFIMDAPLPPSNSVIAKELRTVKVLGILADIINKHLLQPTYQLSETCQFKELLHELGSTHPNKERFLRGMILSVLQDERETAEDHLIDLAVKELMRENGIEDIIPPGSSKDFVSHLEDILGDVQDIWRVAQYSKQMFASDFEHIQIPGSEWSPFKLQASKSTQVPTHDAEDDCIVLFPRIYLMLPGEGPKPITTGAVLSKSQIRAMAREERENNKSAEQKSMRSRNKSGRTLSMSTDARTGHVRDAFLSQAAASS